MGASLNIGARRNLLNFVRRVPPPLSSSSQQIARRSKKLTAFPLAPLREQFDGFLLIRASEIESADVGAEVDLGTAQPHRIRSLGNNLPCGLLGVQGQPAPVDVAELHRLPEPKIAGVGRLLTGTYAESSVFLTRSDRRPISQLLQA